MPIELEPTISPMSNEGEVVCDSILQNKHKTKTYWEQMMMAATTTDALKPHYHHGGVVKRDLLSIGVDSDDAKPHSEVSDQDFYDARSQVSLNSPLGHVDPLDESNAGPKIVETVAKKLVEVDNIKLVKTGDGSVIARDIRIQKEKEEALSRDREIALKKSPPTPMTPQIAQILIEDAAPIIYDATVTSTTSSPTLAETKIAMELREMREREEELRSLRQSLVICKEEEPLVATVVDDNFNSIPNTDEGNYSEYGSEEKELSLDGNNSRMMSPEVPSQVNFLHQRTQSMDSMSSGHSSGSGSGAPESYHTNTRRRVTVKPYEEPEEEEEIPTYMRVRGNDIAEEPIVQLEKVDKITRNLKETPIEREIRLAREREEELRREKRLPPVGEPTTPVANKERRVHRDAITNDPRSVQHRLATNRIQQEINEATEREKELRSAGTIQTTSEDTVDSKVTRFTDLAEYSIEEQDRKLQKAVSTSHIPSGDHPSPSAPKPPRSLALNGTSNHHTLNRSVSTNILSPPNTVSSTMASPTARRFGPSVGQKGLMERFLAARGKLTAVSSFSNSGSPTPNINSNINNHYQHSPIRPVSPVLRQQENASVSLPPMSTPMSTPKAMLDVTPIDERQTSLDSEEKEKERSTPVRKGYTSAEDKIQAELQEMRRREEELRLQRARTFARSQPNLLSIMDHDDADNADEEILMNGDFDSPMSISGLRAALSNPNLLDSEDADNSDKFQPSNRNTRKRNALIAQWENRIQQFTVEH